MYSICPFTFLLGFLTYDFLSMIVNCDLLIDCLINLWYEAKLLQLPLCQLLQIKLLFCNVFFFYYFYYSVYGNYSIEIVIHLSAIAPGYSFFILVFVQIEKNENLMLGVYFPLCLTCWMKRGRNPLSITHIFQALKILVSIKSHATTAWICAEELF